MSADFTVHNIRLDDGTLTKPDMEYSMEAFPWLLSAQRLLNVVFPGDKSSLRLADLGCLEGGYSVEFARMGFDVVGLEIRDKNIEACNYVRSRADLPNLRFVQDDALNVERYGPFDAVFCCGLLYHLEQPKRYLRTLAEVTNKLLILQTHFAMDTPQEGLPLSELSENEGLMGRWYTEFSTDEDFKNRDQARWASWDNRRSFWIQREHLLQALLDAGFDVVMEQYDSLGTIAESMLGGLYQQAGRGTFIGLKS